MKFRLSSAGSFYPEAKAIKLEKLGFKFQDSHSKIAKFYKSEDGDDIEIASLEDLIQFVKDYGQIVLEESTITIYDDYLE